MKFFHLLMLGCLLCLSNSIAQDTPAPDEMPEKKWQDMNEILQSVRTMPDGAIAGMHRNEKIRYKGTVKDAKLHGPWESRFADDSYHEQGKLIRGIPDGEWKVWHENGYPRYLRTYSAHKWERIEQEWRHPHPKFNHPAIIEIYRNDPSLARQLLLQNTQFPSTGNDPKYQPVFSDGLLHGAYINYNSEGKALDSGQYANGLRDGIWIENVHGSLQYWMGKYLRGSREGNWKCVDSRNRVVSLVHYKHGKMIWRKDYP